MDSVQSEGNALLKRLNETKTKVSNSTEDVKGQYCKVLEVRDQTPLTIKAELFGLGAVGAAAEIEIPCIFGFLLVGESGSLPGSVSKARCDGKEEERVGSLLVRGRQSAVPGGTFRDHQDLQRTLRQSSKGLSGVIFGIMQCNRHVLTGGETEKVPFFFSLSL